MADDLLKSIATGGPLTGWGLFVIALLVIGFLYKKVNDLQESRLEAWKQTNDLIDSVKNVILPVVTSLNSIQATLEVLRDRSKQ